ncbi:hypothetical protein BH20ACT22_BH20ACT22_18770 [soil metagenome]
MNSRAGRAPGGYGRAATGAALGVAGLGLLAAFLADPVFGTSPALVLSFDHDGQLELGGVVIFFVVAVAVLLGGPFGAWVALRAGRCTRAGSTAVLTGLLSLGAASFVLSLVPSAPGDPVLEPYGIVVGALLSGLLSRTVVLLLAHGRRNSS